MKKIKVGVISHYYKNNNYGGILQAYALCKILNENGVDAEQISYNMSDKNIAHCNRLYKALYKTSRKVLRVLREINVPHIFSAIKIYKRNLLLQKFRNKIPHTKIVYDLKTIESCCNFDIYITGSDQVWNPTWYDDAYLLNFANPKKVKLSYAASIGKNVLTNENKERFKEALKTYAAISVRENNAVRMLQDFSEKKVELTLDPTLLLGKEEWEKVCDGNVPKDKYVFCYFLGDDKLERDLAFDYAKKNGYQMLSIPYLNGKYRKADARLKCTHVYDVSPERFLNLIKNADYIFTDSFHATLFSHIFQRNFFVFIHSGASLDMSDRIYSLTDMFGTRERVCDSAEKKEIQYLLGLKHINYEKCFPKYERLKENSINFLKTNIKRVFD